MRLNHVYSRCCIKYSPKGPLPKEYLESLLTLDWYVNCAKKWTFAKTFAWRMYQFSSPLLCSKTCFALCPTLCCAPIYFRNGGQLWTAPTCIRNCLESKCKRRVYVIYLTGSRFVGYGGGYLSRDRIIIFNGFFNINVVVIFVITGLSISCPNRTIICCATSCASCTIYLDVPPTTSCRPQTWAYAWDHLYYGLIRRPCVRLKTCAPFPRWSKY